ncbi:hypothetical protein [Halomonas halocynthiae]|uniref:hypothetical protein n=1 Tax=Halomonas halocynthiae TaxID=176290 RepID=UPI0004169EF3|nr:hypothetical protein [Halomonas halocynthiae]
MDVNIDIDALRRKHKTELVERALSVYQTMGDTQQVKSFWLERLLEGQDVRQMLDYLKAGESLPTEAFVGSTQNTCVSAGRIEIIDKDLEFHADGRRNLWVRIENGSADVWETTPEQPLFMAYHWYDEVGNVYDYDGRRTALVKPVSPGEALAMEVGIVNPAEPGNYQLMVTLVMEGQFWMEEKSLKTQRTPLAVLEYDGDGLTRHARDLYHQLKRSVMEVTH